MNLARNLESHDAAEQNYARGYVAGSYDSWIVTTAKTEKGKKLTSCVFTQQSLAVSNVATIFEAYLLKHPNLAHTPAGGVLKAALMRLAGSTSRED